VTTLPSRDEVIVALVIASPGIVFLVVWEIREWLEPRRELRPLFWSEMQPGKRYHVRVDSTERRLKFTDEFVGYAQNFNRARFSSGTVDRAMLDRVMVVLCDDGDENCPHVPAMDGRFESSYEDPFLRRVQGVYEPPAHTAGQKSARRRRA
jgi:hypothetical protein